MWTSTVRFQSDVIENLDSMQTLVDRTLAGRDPEKINLTIVHLNNMLVSSNGMIKALCPNWNEGSFSCPAVKAQGSTRGGPSRVAEDPNRLIVPLLAAQSANMLAMSVRLQSFCSNPGNPCIRSPELNTNRDNVIEVQATGSSVAASIQVGPAGSQTPAQTGQPSLGQPDAAAASDSAPAPLRTAAVTLNPTTASPTGWDVDVFICDDNPAARSQGEAIARKLADISSNDANIASGVTLGRIRQRFMDNDMAHRLTARGPGLPPIFIRSNNPGERSAAEALASAAGIPAGSIRNASTPTPWYLSIFVCPTA